MDYEVPDDLRYVESHEWVRVEDGRARVGITDFAQDELGDVVYVELPDAGDAVAKGDAFGVIESIKAVSDLYAPVSGEVRERNEALLEPEPEPELVNEAPYGDGWMIVVELDDDAELDELLSPDEYADQIG